MTHKLRPLKNTPFCPIPASGSNFNPQNTTCIPVIKIFAFLGLEQKGAFFKGLKLSTIRLFPLLGAFCLVVLLCGPSGVLAHQLSVFAWVEGDTVKVQGNLPKGKHPKQGMVFVYDGNDQLLLKKQIQPDGTATFPLENWETGLKIVMDIGHGHQSYWILTPFDIKQQRTEKQNKD